MLSRIGALCECRTTMRACRKEVRRHDMARLMPETPTAVCCLSPETLLESSRRPISLSLLGGNAHLEDAKIPSPPWTPAEAPQENVGRAKREIGVCPVAPRTGTVP